MNERSLIIDTYKFNYKDMSRHQTIKAIRDEIAQLNKTIDLKIIRGMSYVYEARRHKILMSKLSKMSSNKHSFFGMLGFNRILSFR